MKLFINGIEIPFDQKKLLEFRLVAEFDGDEMGPIRVVTEGETLRVVGNEEQNEAFCFKCGQGDLGKQLVLTGYRDPGIQIRSYTAKEIEERTGPDGILRIKPQE